MNPPLPKVIVFDLGKVLLDFDYAKFAANLGKYTNASPTEIHRLISQSPLLFRFETGLISRDEFFAAVIRETGFTGTQAQFNEVFCNIFEPIPNMIALQQAFRQRGFKTFIFSNTNDLQIEYIRGKYPFIHQFDDYILSFEHGAMKPTASIYEVVEARTGHRGHEILYLDDRWENVEAGRTRGWQVILQESPEKTTATLKNLGLIE